MAKNKKKKTIEEERVILQLENDIETTPDDKTTDLDSFWSAVNNLHTPNKMFKKGEFPTFSFEILSNNEGAQFYFNLPKKYEAIVTKKLNAAYPYIEVKNVEDPILKIKPEENEHVKSYELALTRDETTALKMSGAAKTFLNHLLNSMNHFNEEETSMVQIIVKPLPENWNGKAERRSLNLKKGAHSSNIAVKTIMGILNLIIGAVGLILDTLFTKGQMKKTFKESAATKVESKKEKKKDKLAKPCFNVSIRVVTKSKDPVVADQTAKSIASVYKELDDDNSLRPIKINFSSIEQRELVRKKNNAISSAELSQFAYLPSKGVSADNVAKLNIKKPYDKNVPDKGIVFGYLPQYGDKNVAFPMHLISKKTYDQLAEQYDKLIDNVCKPRLILGQMGTGKSEWIVNYALSLINMGLAVILVDPKNDTQKRLIESMPQEKMHLIDYLDLGDLIFPPALNLLRRRNPGDPTEISLIVQSLISFFKKEFGRSWGFAMQQLIMMTGNAILLDDVATLYEFQLMMTNKEYRGKMIDKIEAKLEEGASGKAMLKELLTFWKQFHSMDEKSQMQRISSTMNKVGIFMSNRIIRAIVSQRESYDFRKAGDQGRITIVNIPDGELGDENRQLLCSFINKAIWLDFRSRTNIQIQERYPTVWLIEEAHMVMDEEFIPILTQSRGYRLGVTILTQGLTNFDNRGMSELKELILTNCKNKVVFRVGPQDARMLQEEFSPVSIGDMMNCPDYHFYSKILLEGGKVSDVFFAHAPDMTPVLRSFDEYKHKHQSGKLTIDEVEDQLDERHQLSDATTISVINMGEFAESAKEEEKSKRPPRKKPGLKFLD
jgi:hypothetical protein